MTLLYIYIYILALWPLYEYFKGLIYVTPEEAKEYHRMRLRARGKFIPPSLDIKPMALELYDHLIIESLNYQTK